MPPLHITHKICLIAIGFLLCAAPAALLAQQGKVIAATGARQMKKLPKGDVLLASFSVRSVYSLAGTARTDFVFEQASNPYTKSIVFPISATAQWRRIQIPFVAADNYAPGAAIILSGRVGT